MFCKKKPRKKVKVSKKPVPKMSMRDYLGITPPDTGVEYRGTTLSVQKIQRLKDKRSN